MESQGAREKTSLLLFPLADINKSWTNARSDLSDVSSQAACDNQNFNFKHDKQLL
jgi:hypothetical protein